MNGDADRFQKKAGMQMKIILMLLLISQVYCFRRLRPEPKPATTVMMEEVILKKNPQMLLHFVMDDLKLHIEAPDTYLLNTAWYRNPEFYDYFMLALEGECLQLEDIESYVNDSGIPEECLNLATLDQCTKQDGPSADLIDKVKGLQRNFYFTNLWVLKGVVDKVDILPALALTDQFSYRDYGDLRLEVKMLREELYGKRQKYLDYLYGFANPDTGYFRTGSRYTASLLERYARASAEEDRFYEVLKKEAEADKEDAKRALSIAEHFRANKSRSDFDMLYSALHSEHDAVLAWAIRQIKAKKFSLLYDELLKVYNERLIKNELFCHGVSRALPFETSCFDPHFESRKVKPGYKLREGF